MLNLIIVDTSTTIYITDPTISDPFVARVSLLEFVGNKTRDGKFREHFR